MIRYLLLVFMVFGSLTASNCNGQFDAAALFEQRTHDFGPVARAAKSVHVFEFANNQKTKIEIADTRTSCDCVFAEVLTPIVEPGDRGKVKVTLNTTAFYGKRSAVVTVTFVEPEFAECQLRVDSFIRKDIVIEPGEINFGILPSGNNAKRSVTIYYAGNPDWKIASVDSSDPRIQPLVKETKRNRSRVEYKLEVKIEGGHESGTINQLVYLSTNDNNRSRIPVAVTGRIVHSIQCPSVVEFGNIPADKTARKKIVLTGSKPFQITDASCEDSKVNVIFPGGSAKVQILTLSVKPAKVQKIQDGVLLGDIHSEIVLSTDDPDTPTLKVIAIGKIQQQD